MNSSITVRFIIDLLKSMPLFGSSAIKSTTNSTNCFSIVFTCWSSSSRIISRTIFLVKLLEFSWNFLILSIFTGIKIWASLVTIAVVKVESLSPVESVPALFKSTNRMWRRPWRNWPGGSGNRSRFEKIAPFLIVDCVSRSSVLNKHCDDVMLFHGFV